MRLRLPQGLILLLVGVSAACSPTGLHPVSAPSLPVPPVSPPSSPRVAITVSPAELAALCPAAVTVTTALERPSLGQQPMAPQLQDALSTLSAGLDDAPPSVVAAVRSLGGPGGGSSPDAALAVVRGYLRCPEPSPTSPPAPLPTVLVGTLTATGTNPGYTASVGYPRLAGLTNVGLEQALNRFLQATAQALITEFAQALAAAGPAPQSTGPGVLRVAEQTTLLTARTLAVRLSGVEEAPGAAEPTEVNVGLVLDLRSGHRYALDELFRPGAGYLQLLSRGAIAELTARFGRADYTGFAGPEQANYAVWTLGADGLEVTFPAAPSALNTPTVTLSYSFLSAVASPTGPLTVR